MRTKEFKRILKTSSGYQLEDRGEWMAVLNGREVVYRIAAHSQGVVVAGAQELYDLETKNRLWLQKLVYEYSRTPIADREPEKKYYVHIIAPWYFGYLNVQKSNDHISLGNSTETEKHQTKFSEKEINIFKSGSGEVMNIDWDKALEPVEEEQ